MRKAMPIVAALAVAISSAATDENSAPQLIRMSNGKLGYLVSRAPAPTTEGVTNPSQVKGIEIFNKIRNLLRCNDVQSGLCADRDPDILYEGRYIGHDEPALAFYSRIPGSGNNQRYTLVLPRDPTLLPTQDFLSGGVWNFQLHPTFWFGLALCDPQSSPEFDLVNCTPDSDSNIAESTNLSSPHYVGKHKGGAFMELQFYPPGWAYGPSCDPALWCAAVTIDSSNFDQNNDIDNGAACLDSVSDEPVNFAFITTDGIPPFPPNPAGIPFGRNANFDFSHVLLMNPGDTIVISIRDTSDGLAISMQDVTTGQSGTMIAGAVNGFGQIQFTPDRPGHPSPCFIAPFNFRAMYASSTEHTTLTWTAHQFNVGFSDELGHFEYCNRAAADFDITGTGVFVGKCTVPGYPDNVTTGLDSDDTVTPSFCAAPNEPGYAAYNPPPFIQVGACTNDDLDFDGVSYTPRAWPGTLPPAADAMVHPEPVQFKSPTFAVRRGRRQTLNYSRVAFETDLPSFEQSVTPCSLFDGTGCVIPAVRGSFYPIYSTTRTASNCYWQFGGNAFTDSRFPAGTDAGGQYGASPISLIVPRHGPSGPFAAARFLDFRTVHSNPCPAIPLGK